MGVGWVAEVIVWSLNLPQIYVLPIEFDQFSQWSKYCLHDANLARNVSRRNRFIEMNQPLY